MQDSFAVRIKSTLLGKLTIGDFYIYKHVYMLVSLLCTTFSYSIPDPALATALDILNDALSFYYVFFIQDFERKTI